MFATGVTMALAEWIIGDTNLVYFIIKVVLLFSMTW